MAGFTPQPLEVDQDTARDLFETGAKLLLLDVPEGTEVGVDYNAWSVGPRFKGVKFIPPGVHFIYYSALDKKTNQHAPRTGFFHCFAQGEVLVRKWNAEAEDVDCETDTDQVERLRLAIREFDPHLGPYPLSTHHTWRGLAGYVTGEVLVRHMPPSGKVHSVEVLAGEPGQNKFESVLLPDKHHTLRTTPIPKQSHPPGASADLVTRYSMDRSWLLGHMLQTKYKGDSNLLLGELQFVFVCFFLGHSHSGFEQWKGLVGLLGGCQEALVTHPDLFVAFMDVLHVQLQETPPDFFVDIVSRHNFLAHTLQGFFSACRQDGVPKSVVQRASRLQDAATKRFGWNFDMEDEEDMPVVVDL